MNRIPADQSNFPNLFSELPDASSEEQVNILMHRPGMRIERIVSEGQASPPDYWYDQDETEWVAVLKGAARLQIEGEQNERNLLPGDAVILPARTRHRVTWTDPSQPTIWLAVFVEETR